MSPSSPAKAEAARTAEPGRIATAIRKEIRDSGLSHYALAKLAGVPAPVVDRFMSGQRSLALGSVDRLAEALGLYLARAARPAGRPNKAQARARAAAKPKAPGKATADHA